MVNESNIPWAEKYRPKLPKDMVGFQHVFDKLKTFVTEFYSMKNELKILKAQQDKAATPIEKKKIDLKLKSFQAKLATKRARLLIGPPGVGKTTVVYCLANDMNCSVIELNASDVRSQDAIKTRLSETVKSTNLLSFTIQKSTGKIILIDEVDGISGQSDRGGVAALVKIIENTQFPILMTCNFWDDQKFKALLASESQIIELQPAKPEDVPHRS